MLSDKQCSNNLRKFNSSFSSFDTGVHRQHLIVLEERSYKICVFTELIIMESTGCQSKVFSLVIESFKDSRMTVALINSGISRQKI